MAHHSKEPFEESQLSKLFEGEGSKLEPNFINMLGKLGATGKHPEGKLTDNDEGEIRFGITIYKGKLIIDFGKQVHWIGLTKQQIIDLARLIMKRAEEL